MDSTVACHLHNSTFYVKDPESQETDNDSNPSIRQLHQAGFSSKNCLFFDDICRRDRTKDVEAFYTEELICTHREFTLSVRKAMSAKVELWGEYEGVELFLEIENRTAVRFILKKFGRNQDLHLSVAGKLGGIEITPNFYESKHLPHHYGQFDNASNHVVKRLEKEADDQLRAAFPEQYKKIEAGARALAEKVKIEAQQTLCQLSG
ncbi:hypothetical protein TCE0_042f15183 [Talaromyces pinophilus]|uniref:Uncharacterized protein n=1 Tax=Talaromyces pinophilus TaxID=128442 RepID=A0A6V8HJE4_TALPI|nr:hypothetical protein TCE0_042f15183 [Talaromyces pinophilus]